MKIIRVSRWSGGCSPDQLGKLAKSHPSVKLSIFKTFKAKIYFKFKFIIKTLFKMLKVLQLTICIIFSRSRKDRNFRRNLWAGFSGRWRRKNRRFSNLYSLNNLKIDVSFNQSTIIQNKFLSPPRCRYFEFKTKQR